MSITISSFQKLCNNCIQICSIYWLGQYSSNANVWNFNECITDIITKYETYNLSSAKIFTNLYITKTQTRHRKNGKASNENFIIICLAYIPVELHVLKHYQIYIYKYIKHGTLDWTYTCKHRGWLSAFYGLNVKQTNQIPMVGNKWGLNEGF